MSMDRLCEWSFTSSKGGSMFKFISKHKSSY